MPLTATKTLAVALVGNPNTGKSTLFSALCGVRQRTGNYPGVTVEKKIGTLRHGETTFSVVDLPGTYSLAPRSPDEMVAVDVLLGRRGDVPPCDAVVCIVDASNLERNLYVVSQVLELGLPTVLALNMIDVARERGLTVDIDQLRTRLGIPVVEVQANKRVGLDALKQALVEVVGKPVNVPASPFPEVFQTEVQRLAETVSNGQTPPRYLVERLLLDTTGYLQQAEHFAGLHASNGQLADNLTAARGRLAEAGFPVPAVEAMARYDWVGRVLAGVVTRPRERPRTNSDRLDQLLTHRVWGTLVFTLLMLALFSSIFVLADPVMGAIEGVFGSVGEWLGGWLPEGALQSLVVDGVIGGVGGVLVFLPQILLLFGFIAVLEDCGYMARAAYLMDKLMVRAGLSGKSFIPLLSSFACAIPGIMGARVIENRRDRLTTILIAPLMSCSARLPVYMLLIGAFIPPVALLGGWLPLQGVTLFGMYLVGVVLAVVVALLLKRTILRGPTPPFVLELPPYKFPSLAVVLQRMWGAGWSFIYRAGTLILAVSIVVWALLYYPRDAARAEADLTERRAELQTLVSQHEADDPHRDFLAGELARFDIPDEREQLLAGAYQRQSYLGQLGRGIEPAVKPLGWDWRVGAAVIASFPAREVVLGTLGVIYNLGDVDLDEEAGRTQLQAQLRGATWDGTDRPVFSIPVALGLMVFFALCAQCAATLVVMRRETGSWRWPAFTFVYMTALAYVGALVTYRVALWLVW